MIIQAIIEHFGDLLISISILIMLPIMETDILLLTTSAIMKMW